MVGDQSGVKRWMRAHHLTSDHAHHRALQSLFISIEWGVRRATFGHDQPPSCEQVCGRAVAHNPRQAPLEQWSFQPLTSGLREHLGDFAHADRCPIGYMALLIGHNDNNREAVVPFATNGLDRRGAHARLTSK
jgi:hypothetical protein